MPQAAFIVKLNLRDVSDGSINAANEVLLSAAEDAGLPVVSVDPWDRSSLLAQAISPPALLSGSPFQVPSVPTTPPIKAV